MKKILLFIALILLLSMANAIEAEPYSKEDFKLKMDTAVSYNIQQTKLKLFYEDESGLTQEQADELAETFERLESLKQKAITEYNVFFDAYYDADSKKVKTQTEKLTAIFNEMNSLMNTVIKFDEISKNIVYWSVMLDYYIEKGIFKSKEPVIDTENKVIKAVKEQTYFGNPVSDINVEDPVKPKQDFDFVVPIAVILILFVIGIIYVVFFKR